MSSKSKRTSSLRRSRSPRRKKSVSPGPQRRRMPIRGKRPPSRDNYDDKRLPSKRPRSPRKRSRTPPRPTPTARRRTYSGSRDMPFDQASSSHRHIVRDGVNSRLHFGERYVVDRPLYSGPEEDLPMDRDSLKKIVVKMRNTPSGNDNIIRDIVNPEEINVVRRAGEGSRPIFDRDEIVNYGRNGEEGEQERERIASRSPVRSGRRHSSSERFRARETLYEDRNENIRDYSRRRPTRDYRSYDRPRDERSRYPPAKRDYSRERKNSYDERDDHRSFRRSPGRSAERLRRRPSPRRRIDDYRPVRERSLERRAPSPEMRGEMSSGRGRGPGFSLGERALSGSRGFPAPAEIIMHPMPPVRPFRGAFLPRMPGRRFPFPPRIVRPIVRPVIRVIAPVIHGRPPVLPGGPPVLPVRHPVLPLPF